MIESIIKPKCPIGPGWQQVVNPNTRGLDSLGYPHETWLHDRTGVFVPSADSCPSGRFTSQEQTSCRQ